MSQCAVIYLICTFGVFQKGLTALIETQQTVMAAVGEEAHFNCQLMQTKDVLQVTWQKMSPDGVTNLATYNKRFGQRVNSRFQGKVAFKAAGLMNCSIVIRRLTDIDEGCYRCLFNTYPEGAFTGRTCLQLYELHEPILHVRESTEEAAVSCSATGRPAPTVTLTVPHCNSTTVTNTNGTVTVTATAVLPRLHDNSTQVGCAVRVLSGPPIKVLAIVPEVKQSSADDVDEECGSNHCDRSGTWIILWCVVLSVAVLCGCTAAVIFLRKQRNQNSLSHRDHSMMPQTTVYDTEKTQEPLVTQQTSSVKIQTSDHPNLSPSASRRV